MNTVIEQPTLLWWIPIFLLTLGLWLITQFFR